MPTEIAFEQLKKKGIIFGLEDVLVPGKIDSAVSMDDVQQILSELSALEKKFETKGFHLFLITGLPEKIALQKIQENQLGEFFKVGHIFFVNESYVNAKSEVDKALYDQHLEKDPAFKDEYFKQVIIEKIAKTEGLSNEFVNRVLIKSRFKGERLSRDPELNRYIQDNFPAAFLSKLWGTRIYEDTIIKQMIDSLSPSDGSHPTEPLH